MKKHIVACAFAFCLFLAVACGSAFAESHEHEWLDATCLEPKTCAVCGAVEGEALGHDWSDACIAAPKRCVRCGITEGTYLKKTPKEFIKLFNKEYGKDGFEIKKISDVYGDNWYLISDGLENPAQVQFLEGLGGPGTVIASTGTGDTELKRDDWGNTVVYAKSEGFTKEKFEFFLDVAEKIGAILGDDLDFDEIEHKSKSASVTTDILKYSLEFDYSHGGSYELRIAFKRWE